MLDELRAMLTTKQQKMMPEQIENCQLSLIALSEMDAFFERFKLGMKRQQKYTQKHSSGDDAMVIPAVILSC